MVVVWKVELLDIVPQPGSRVLEGQAACSTNALAPARPGLCP
eukprot:CAMPEP_0184293376 /NCGR_PEP_ID=MMETSP1049-20130417/4825_1 /TAXON_ID=77928 /ORGANISM="Proteomonas sulcata, Strain CCMP704" /LENGTH=41 /DNA_ID= /DNA_START= /DNA_END= /DNA_ORIENTATION=